MSWGMGAGQGGGQWTGPAMNMNPTPATGQWGTAAPAAGQWGNAAMNPAAAAGQWGMPAAGYPTDQWTSMQQQQWQQWAQWQQQYVQWQAQYGDKFAKQMQGMPNTGMPSTGMPNMGVQSTGMPNSVMPSVMMQSTGMPSTGMPPLPTGAAPPAPPPPTEKPPPPPPHENNQPLYAQSTPVAPTAAPAVMAVAAPTPVPTSQVLASRQGNTNAGTPSVPESAPSVINAEALKKLAEEERLFDIQFQKWEEEIEKWKQENANHPDKQAYKEYEQKFEACRMQLLERRQQMNTRKARLLGIPATTTTPAVKIQTPAVSTPAATAPAATADSVQGYQNNTQFYPNQDQSQNNPASTQPPQNIPNQNNQWQNVPNQGSQSVYSTPVNNYQGTQQYNNADPTKLVNNQQENKNVSQNQYEASTAFLLSNVGAKGIPGLDLVPEDKSVANMPPVIDITNEAGKPHGPDYSNISKGINNILGDEKIMNILNMVKGQAPPTVPNTTTNQSVTPSNQVITASATYNMPPPNVQVPATNQVLPASQVQPANQVQVTDPAQSGTYNMASLNYQNMPLYYQNSLSNQNQWNYYNQYSQYNNTMQQNQTNNVGNYQQNQYYNQYGGYNQNMPSTNQMNPPALMGVNQNVTAKNQMGDKLTNGPPPLMGLTPNVPQLAMQENTSSAPADPWADEPMFTPDIIVEYDHKPLRLKAREFIEPAHMHDYNHISKEDEFKHKDFEREADGLFVQAPRREPYQRTYQTEPDRNYERRMPRQESRLPPRAQFDDRWKVEPRIDDRRWEEPRRNEFGHDEHSKRDDFMRNDRSRWDSLLGTDRFAQINNTNSREGSMDSRKRAKSKESDTKSETSKKAKEPKKAEPKKVEPKKAEPPRVIMIDDILEPPGRDIRPEKIVIILRGPPGSGKSHLAKLIRDREAEYGGAARIMSIDDYFMQESEVEETDPITGKIVKKPTLKYEYDPKSEETYLNSLKRAFKRSITDGYFNFLIYDAINDQLKSYADIWNFSRQNNFQVYVVTLPLDAELCYSRCTHGRSMDDIQVIVARWFSTPAHHLQLDVTTLLQPTITDVTMEEPVNSTVEPITEVENSFTSKWEKMDDAQQLARLDGTSKPLHPPSLTMHDYLQLDDWQPAGTAAPGKKTVRWADIEERRAQERARAVGFVVGGTDWGRLTDPGRPQLALAQTNYIERIAPDNR